jgi:hypothetical protein
MAEVALLAPVPSDLLDDARDEGKTTVAFGSMAWDFFRQLSDEVGEEPLDAYIYASHAGELTLEASWTGKFVGWRDAIEAEGDPSFRELRTKLALEDWAGNEEGGRWAVYWIIEDLCQLETPLKVGDVRLPGGRKLSSAFVPRGPLRIQAP